MINVRDEKLVLFVFVIKLKQTLFRKETYLFTPHCFDSAYNK